MLPLCGALRNEFPLRNKGVTKKSGNFSFFGLDMLVFVNKIITV